MAEGSVYAPRHALNHIDSKPTPSDSAAESRSSQASPITHGSGSSSRTKHRANAVPYAPQSFGVFVLRTMVLVPAPRPAGVLAWVRRIKERQLAAWGLAAAQYALAPPNTLSAERIHLT